MKRISLRLPVIFVLILTLNAGLLFAETAVPDGSVMCRTNTALVQTDGVWTPVTAPKTMAGGIKVSTNGTFQVNAGKPRLLQDGQVLRPDGNLLNPDGSIVPVVDHIAMSGAAVTVFKDGDGTALADPLTLPDGSGISPDGSFTRPGGRRSRLVDGQMLTLDGTPINGLDTIRFSNGKVAVCKAGALLPLSSPNVIMGMFDGTRVSGDGKVTFPDGSTTQLAEGEIITVPGVRANW